MRLAYLSSDPGVPFGGSKGASIHVSEMVAALAAAETEVLVLVAEIEPGVAPPTGVTVEPLPGPDTAATATERIGYQHDLAAWLTWRLEQFAPDAMYERLALYADAGAVAARRLGIPHLVELNAPLPEEAARYRTLDEPAAAKRLESATISGADLVFAVSPTLAEYAERRGARRVEVLQNAAAIEQYPARRRGDGRPVAVFSGSLRPWHGLETIAAAWRLLGAAAPRLLVVGDGPSRGLLDGLDARLVGRVPPARVPYFLCSADIGLAPYGVNTPLYFSPIKLFEYLAAGLATIVADLPAVRAVVDDDTAVLMPAGDAVALAEAVSGLSSDPAERRRLGQNGRLLIEAQHTWRHRARRILEAAGELAATAVAG
jgi:glycosyltransferase involved in cell wall biosynthesis